LNNKSIHLTSDPQRLAYYKLNTTPKTLDEFISRREVRQIPRGRD